MEHEILNYSPRVELKSGTLYEGLTFSELDFSEGAVHSSTFEMCEFEYCDFTEAEFENCNYRECFFKSSNLSLVKLLDTRFVETGFESCKVTGVNWGLLNWAGTALSSPMSFESCDVSFSVFNSLNLPGLIMRNCKAHDVDFESCDLTGGNFAKTDLANTRFNSTKLNGCDFREAINYYINPNENSVAGANFSVPEVLNLLSSFGIRVDEVN